MRTVNLADAKAHFSELVSLAAEGEIIDIARRGKPAARLTAAKPERKPMSLSALRALTDTMPLQPETAGDFMRKVRDDQRY